MTRFIELPWALALAPLFAGAVAWMFVVSWRRRSARLRRMGEASVVARLVPPAVLRTPRTRALLLAGAAAFAALAFAGPRWGEERTTVRSSGADIILAMDASLSMLAQDERPNRLARMKQEALRLLSTSSGDRIGLIAFAGRSYILSPLTVDRGALELFLDNLDPGVVGQAGSSLERAIRQGTELLLLSRSGSDRALVVMTDGESFETPEGVLDAAKRAGEAGIALVTVGFGTAGGATIPVQMGEATVPKRDENGQVVVTRYDGGLLQRAAEAARGTFIDASATDKAARVRRALAVLRRTKRPVDVGRDLRPRYQLFLLPALLLALADTLLAERRGRRRTRVAAAAKTAAALVLLAVPAARASATGAGEGDRLFRAKRYGEAAQVYARAIARGDTAASTYYNLGTALIAAGKGEEAVAPLERAAQARDLEVRYRALFNLGLVYLERGRSLPDDPAEQAYAAAVDAYKRALRIRGRELDAKWNYELANRRRKEKSGGGGGGGAGGGGGDSQEQTPPEPPRSPVEQPAGGLDPRQAEQLLNSAAREERDVQGKRQRQSQPQRPPGGKDW